MKKLRLRILPPDSTRRVFPVLILLLSGLAPEGLLAASPWPQLPEQAASAELSGISWQFASGLYESILTSDVPATPDELSFHRRAALATGQFDEVAFGDFAAGDGPEALLYLLASDEPVSDLTSTQIRDFLTGEDGESSYWLARLELHLGRIEACREAVTALLRRMPGSVFAPSALELLASLPQSESPEPDSVLDPGAVAAWRVQWGVFSDRDRAAARVQQLSALGEEAVAISFSREDGSTLYRVCSRSFSEKKDAQVLGDHLLSRYGLEFALYYGTAHP